MNELDEYLAKKALNLRDLLKNEHMNDEYTRGWNEMKDQALYQCVIARSPEAHERILSLKPMNTPEVERRACWCNKCRKSWTEAEQMEFSLSHRCVNPLLGKCSFCNECKAEPDWEELKFALYAAGSKNNEIAKRGVDRVVSFFKKLHERTEPEEHHIAHAPGICSECDSKRPPPPPPDLTEEELRDVLEFYGEKTLYIPRIISELRRRRKEDATELQKAFDRGARCERSRMSVEAKENDSKALFIRRDKSTLFLPLSEPARIRLHHNNDVRFVEGEARPFNRIAPGIYLEA